MARSPRVDNTVEEPTPSAQAEIDRLLGRTIPEPEPDPIEEAIQSLERSRGGRPTTYNEEITDQILFRISNGEGLTTICREDGFPAYSTVMLWIKAHPEFSEKYTQAREDQAQYYADELMDVSKKTLAGQYDAQAARVFSDNLKWTASKLLPKKYGDKVDMTTNGKDLPQPILAMLTMPLPDSDTTDEIEREVIEGQVTPEEPKNILDELK